MTAAGDLYPTAALYLLLVNSITYAAFWIDKTQARKRGYRLSENALLLLSALGGSPCALLARSYLRHKTKKQPFATLLFLIVGIQAIVIGWFLFASPPCDPR